MPIIVPPPVAPLTPPVPQAPGVGGRTNVSANYVVRELRDQLALWLPVYIAEQERIEGFPQATIPMPQAFVVGADRAVVHPEDGFPCVVVTSPGLAGDPQRRTYQMWDLPFAIATGVILANENEVDNLDEILRAYVAAIRLCLLHKALKNIDGTLDFTDEIYDIGEPARARSYAVGEIGLQVLVENAVVLGQELFPNTDPPDNPYEPPIDVLPVVDQVFIEIDKQPITS